VPERNSEEERNSYEHLIRLAAAGQEVFIHPQALVESDSIGQGTRIWTFAHVMQGARIGAGCNIGDHAFIESGAIVGNGVTVKNGVAMTCRTCSREFTVAAEGLAPAGNAVAALMEAQ
jgi:UDP-3-O-[3-hydroxymyristoyl] glucosamine N-acyltransferase